MIVWSNKIKDLLLQPQTSIIKIGVIQAFFYVPVIASSRL